MSDENQAIKIDDAEQRQLIPRYQHGRENGEATQVALDMATIDVISTEDRKELAGQIRKATHTAEQKVRQEGRA